MSLLLTESIQKEFKRLNDNIISLRAGVREAMEWNWLDEDAPLDVRNALITLLERTS